MPENLETGEYKVTGTTEIDDLEPWYIVAYSKNDDFGYSYNGIYSGIQFYGFSGQDELRAWLTNLIAENPEYSQYVSTIFSVPKLAFNPLTQLNHKMDDDFIASPKTVQLSSTPLTLDGYIPHNQKLRTYPYCYIGFNPTGSNGKIYRYEDFNNGTPIFNLISEINPDPTVAVIPQNYRGVTGDSMQDTATITGYPTISWAIDTYNVWLAQNSQKINLSMANLFDNTRLSQGQNIANIAGAGLSLATSFAFPTSPKPIKAGSAIGSIGDTFSNVTNTAIEYGRNNINYEYQVNMQLAEMQAHKQLPDTLNFGSSNATLIGYNKFDKNIFTRYTIKEQFAKRIDQFFDMYGYATRELKVPNTSNRPNWNYVKLIGANIIGDIPEVDILAIKDLFNNGITLWHNSSTFLDYSQNNR